MTSSAENRIDEWIGRVKQRGAMAAFAFVPAYPANKTPNPVAKYTVAVTAQEVKTACCFIGGVTKTGTKGRLYDIRLLLRVYAPERSPGSSLLRASAMLADALEAQDSERLIRSLELSDIGYDTAARTEYRDVVAWLSMAEEADA